MLLEGPWAATSRSAGALEVVGCAVPTGPGACTEPWWLGEPSGKSQPVAGTTIPAANNIPTTNLTMATTAVP